MLLVVLWYCFALSVYVKVNSIYFDILKNENNTSIISTILEVLFGTIQSEFFDNLRKQYLEVLFFEAFSGSIRSGLRPVEVGSFRPPLQLHDNI